MNGEKCKLEGDDWILIDSKGEEGEFIFVSPEDKNIPNGTPIS